MKKPQIIAIIILILGAAGILYAVIAMRPSEVGQNNANTPALVGFAQCLKDKGATFYGAFWCPHCQNQKKLFGNAVSALPYVECSTPDAQGQLQVCIDKKIQNYPTWEFADGTRKTGEVPLAELAEKTGCTLPQ